MKSATTIRVLYAEDNEDAGFMLTTLLGFSGIEATVAETIAKAWRLVQAESFDLYLLDTNFPDGDGFELCKKLREFALHTPIVFYSGKAYQSDKEKGISAGANAYLVKPYSGSVAATIIQLTKQTNDIAAAEKVEIWQNA